MKASADHRAMPGMVGMGEVHTGAGVQELHCVGVGSGVVVAAYEPQSQLGVCAHFILPHAPAKFDPNRPAKYVDTGFAELIRQMVTLGADKSRIRVALAGGSSLLAAGGGDSTIDLGARNLEAIRTALEDEGFSCMAQDVGGQVGRTVSFSIRDGAVRVRAGMQPDRVLCKLRG